MDRRDFLERISAAAAAFMAAGAGGLALPASAAASATKATGISVDTSKFKRTVGDAGRELVELLRQCRVRSLSWRGTRDSWRELHAVFASADESAPRTHLDRQAWAAVESGALKSISVSQAFDSVDVRDYFGYAMFPVEKSHYEIEATWLVPTS